MDDTETVNQDAENARSACTECSRRKQKCNREWPCNHCQKRKVIDQCFFKTPAVKTPPEQLAKKRGREVDIESVDDNTVGEGEDDDHWGGLETLGYAQGHFPGGISEGDEETEKRVPKENMRTMSSCPQLQRALDALPSQSHTDALVHNFFNNANFHFYIVYPKRFLDEYQKWWDLRASNAPLSLPWICLLLEICACSTQYIPEDLQKKLASDLGASSQILTEKYHEAAKDLRSAIPVGNAHFLNVQSLLHAVYWHKSEAQFVECWHVLSSAVREAQELGIDKEGVQGNIPEFERELHRRVWTVMNTWDWQMSALLSRPMIIDRSDIDIGFPSLTLEDFSISPLLHMKLQSELITKLSARFGLPKNVTSPEDVQEFQKIMEAWMSAFPSTYDFKNPDTSHDVDYPWLVLHRHYLHSMTYSMTLEPFRAYLAKPMNSKTTSLIALQIRRDGIDYALKIMDALHVSFSHVWPRDAKFHFVIFCIFDTAAVFSSVIMHDEDNSAPKRDKIMKAMEGALDMVKRLSTLLPAAGLYYNILQRLYNKTLKKINGGAKQSDVPRKKARIVQKSSTSSEAAQLSDVPASSAESLPIERSSSSTLSSGPKGESEASLTEPPPLANPHPASTLAPQTLYDFNQTPLLDENFPIQDQPLFDETAYILDGGGDLPPLPVGELTSNVECVPDFADPGLPDLTWEPMSQAELGPLGDLWRWNSLDLGLVQEGINPAELDLGNGAYGGFRDDALGIDEISKGGVTENFNGIDGDVNGGVGGTNEQFNDHVVNGQALDSYPGNS